MIEVRIGVIENRKELAIEVEEEAETVKEVIEAALKEQGTLWLKDRKGKQFGIPVTKLAYVEISTDMSTRPVGFGSR